MWHRIRKQLEEFLCKEFDQPNFASLVSSFNNACQSGPCTTIWQAGEVAYRCRTCQTTLSSAICVECFRAGGHDKHDYLMYHSPVGGCCDCGDLSSWKAEGCCPKHQPYSSSSSVPLLPEAAAENLRKALHVAFLSLTFHVQGLNAAAPARTSVRAAHSDELVSWSQWLQQLCAPAVVRVLAVPLLCQKFPQQGDVSNWMEGDEALEQLQILTDTVTAVLPREGAPVHEDCLLRRWIATLPYLPDRCLVEVTNLMLVLLYDMDFKYHTAAHLLDYYPLILNSTRANANQPGVMSASGVISATLDRMSVQVFNIEDVTRRLLQDEALLESVLEQLRWCVQFWVLALPESPNPLEPSPDLDTALHCYKRILMDIVAIIQHPAAVEYLISGPLDQLLSIMDLIQSQRSYARVPSGDVLPRTSSCLTLLTLEIHLAELLGGLTQSLMALSKNEGAALKVDSSVGALIFNCMRQVNDKLQEWLLKSPPLPGAADWWVQLAAGEVKVPPHLLLNRMLAILARTAFAIVQQDGVSQQGEAAQQLLELVVKQSESGMDWEKAARHILLLKVMSTQAELQMWVRNGEDVMRVLMYQQYCVEIMAEPDLLTLQLWLASKPEAAVTEWLLAYGAGPLLQAAGALPPPNEDPSSAAWIPQLQHDRCYEGVLVGLGALVRVLRARHIVGSSPRQRIRHLLLQSLAVQDTGHTQLISTLSLDLQNSPEVEEELSALAVCTQPSLSQSAKYQLKREHWQEYSPHYALCNRAEAQVAYERACSLGGYKPHWQLKAPAPVPAALAGMMRCVLSPVVLKLVHFLLCQHVDSSWKDKVEHVAEGAAGARRQRPEVDREIDQLSRFFDEAALWALNLLALALHHVNQLPSEDEDVRRLVATLGGSASDPSTHVEPNLLVVLDKVRSSKSSDVAECAGWLLDLARKFAARDVQVTDGGKNPAKEAEERKKQARARQMAMLSRMKAQQAAFAASQIPDSESDSELDMEAGPDRGTKGESEQADEQQPWGVLPVERDGACVVCHEREETSESGPLSWLANVHCCGVLCTVLGEKGDWRQGVHVMPNDSSPLGIIRRHGVTYSQFDSRSGLHVHCCGHLMHSSCYGRILKGNIDAHNHRTFYHGYHLLNPVREVLCPACSRLGNCVLPALAFKPPPGVPSPPHTHSHHAHTIAAQPTHPSSTPPLPPGNTQTAQIKQSAGTPQPPNTEQRAAASSHAVGVRQDDGDEDMPDAQFTPRGESAACSVPGREPKVQKVDHVLPTGARREAEREGDVTLTSAPAHGAQGDEREAEPTVSAGGRCDEPLGVDERDGLAEGTVPEWNFDPGQTSDVPQVLEWVRERGMSSSDLTSHEIEDGAEEVTEQSSGERSSHDGSPETEDPRSGIVRRMQNILAGVAHRLHTGARNTEPAPPSPPASPPNQAEEAPAAPLDARTALSESVKVFLGMARSKLTQRCDATERLVARHRPPRRHASPSPNDIGTPHSPNSQPFGSAAAEWPDSSTHGTAGGQGERGGTEPSGPDGRLGAGSEQLLSSSFGNSTNSILIQETTQAARNRIVFSSDEAVMWSALAHNVCHWEAMIRPCCSANEEDRLANSSPSGVLSQVQSAHWRALQSLTALCISTGAGESATTRAAALQLHAVMAWLGSRSAAAGQPLAAANTTGDWDAGVGCQAPAVGLVQCTPPFLDVPLLRRWAAAGQQEGRFHSLKSNTWQALLDDPFTLALELLALAISTTPLATTSPSSSSSSSPHTTPQKVTTSSSPSVNPPTTNPISRTVSSHPNWTQPSSSSQAQLTPPPPSTFWTAIIRVLFPCVAAQALLWSLHKLSHAPRHPLSSQPTATPTQAGGVAAGKSSSSSAARSQHTLTASLAASTRCTETQQPTPEDGPRISCLSESTPQQAPPAATPALHTNPDAFAADSMMHASSLAWEFCRSLLQPPGFNAVLSFAGREPEVAMRDGWEEDVVMEREDVDEGNVAPRSNRSHSIPPTAGDHPIGELSYARPGASPGSAESQISHAGYVLDHVAGQVLPLLYRSYAVQRLLTDTTPDEFVIEAYNQLHYISTSSSTTAVLQHTPANQTDMVPGSSSLPGATFDINTTSSSMHPDSNRNASSSSDMAGPSTSSAPTRAVADVAQSSRTSPHPEASHSPLSLHREGPTPSQLADRLLSLLSQPSLHTTLQHFGTLPVTHLRRCISPALGHILSHPSSPTHSTNTVPHAQTATVNRATSFPADAEISDPSTATMDTGAAIVTAANSTDSSAITPPASGTTAGIGVAVTQSERVYDPHTAMSTLAPSGAPASVAGGQTDGMSSAAPSSLSSPLSPIMPPTLPRRPSLLSLPSLFQDLYLHYYNKPCRHCHKAPALPALCLVTGQFLCSWSNGCPSRLALPTMFHELELCGGTGAYLMLKPNKSHSYELTKCTRVVVQRMPRLTVCKTVYLDAHGEEDEEMKRGKPLHLNRASYGQVSLLWAAGALDFDSFMVLNGMLGLRYPMGLEMFEA